MLLVLQADGGSQLVRASATSDIGRVRKTNEDAFVSAADLDLFAVADGMGGHKAGEVAARLAIDALIGFIRQSKADTTVHSRDDTDTSWPYGIDDTLSATGNRLRTAIHLANRRIFREAQNNQAFSGMGTTIVGILIQGTRLAVGHVGDSRLYLLRSGAIEQLTEDDSWAATILAHDPSVKPGQLERHPMRHVLTNALGARDQVQVHVSERELQAGDVFLLCSDGLHGVLDNDTIRTILEEQPSVEEAARALVGSALHRGSRDNVTALVVRYEAGR